MTAASQPSHALGAIWDRLATPGVSDAVTALQARAFGVFLLMHLTARVWFWDLRDDATPQRLPLAILITLCFLVGLSRSRLRLACTLAATGLAINLALLFPHVSNHYFLETACVGLFAFFNMHIAAERRLFLATCRGLAVIVLFSSGVQKILYGTYFDGQFLGYLTASYDRFQDVFRWLMSPSELARLTSLSTEVGAGPFAVDSALVVFLSNATYLGEILLAVLLLWKRSRRFAVWFALVFVVLIELGARELMFGALFANLLLLFDHRPLGRRLLPFFAAGYLALHLVEALLPWKVFN